MRNIRFEQRSSDGFLRVGHGKIPVALGKNDLGREVWGWVLPGGVFTADRELAMRAAEIVHSEIETCLRCSTWSNCAPPQAKNRH